MLKQQVEHILNCYSPPPPIHLIIDHRKQLVMEVILFLSLSLTKQTISNMFPKVNIMHNENKRPKNFSSFKLWKLSSTNTGRDFHMKNSHLTHLLSQYSRWKYLCSNHSKVISAIVNPKCTIPCFQNTITYLCFYINKKPNRLK